MDQPQVLSVAMLQSRRAYKVRDDLGSTSIYTVEEEEREAKRNHSDVVILTIYKKMRGMLKHINIYLYFSI